MKAYDKFDQLYEQCYKYNMSVLKKYAVTEQDAEDAFNEAITTFWMHWKRGDLKNQKNIPAFVCVTAIRLLGKWKKKKAETVEESILEQETAAEDFLNSMFEKIPNTRTLLMQKAFKRLGEMCQNLITSKYIYKHSYQDIAEDFGHKTSDVAKTQTYRCMKKVKAFFKEEVAKLKKKTL